MNTALNPALKLTLTYGFLAVLATIANIGAQDLATRLYAGAYHVPLSVFFGTGVGLVVKYLLDKRYIFQYVTKDLKHDGKTFVLYVAMGLITTAIFWGFAFGFDHLFATKEMRYVGSVIGLSIGYVTKYFLDKKYVFVTPKQL